MMKYQILLYAVLLFNYLYIQADPLLVAVVMVKDQAPVIEVTLKSLIDAGIKHFLMYDTGSTDDTIQITRDFFIKNNISNYVIEQGDWINVATSRNYALELTEQHFPDATFMLMLDAEWILHNGSDLLQYCKQQQHSAIPLYFIQVIHGDMESAHARLIRCKEKISFENKAYEALNIVAQRRIPHHIYFENNSTEYGAKQVKAESLRDLQFLLQAIQVNPDDARAVFCLAQTYCSLGDVQDAIKWYERRETMSGCPEENFFTVFMLARLYQETGQVENMIEYYFKAFSMRPHRADPLIRLAQYYYSVKAYHLCYLLTKYTASMPYPHTELGMVEKWMYEFVRYDLLSATASIVGDYKLGKQATIKAIEVCPTLQYLHDNLQYYQQMLP